MILNIFKKLFGVSDGLWVLFGLESGVENPSVVYTFALFAGRPMLGFSSVAKNAERHGKAAWFLIMLKNPKTIIRVKKQKLFCIKSVNNPIISYSRPSEKNGLRVIIKDKSRDCVLIFGVRLGLLILQIGININII
ncbi:hypothetical protein [Neisseria yangbaofengii]|uniref:hypothetical protein n=1 Tax=Neisseria yangbaofengii TaxID=2709396 RepID=UPI0013EC5EBE|nr:hypothetical protein [Neisseria yangbaofengii]